MAKTRLTALAYLASMTCVLLACGGGGISNKTPRDVVESMHKASISGDFESMAKLVEPNQQEAMLAMGTTTQELLAATKSLRMLVEDKLGAEQAQLLGGNEENSSPFAAVATPDGSLDWSRIEIAEDGDKAVIEVDGKPYGDRLVRIDGKWFVSTGNGKSPEEMMQQADKVRESADKMMIVVKELEEGIHSGEVTKDNFQQKYMSAAFKAMTGK